MNDGDLSDLVQDRGTVYIVYENVNLSDFDWTEWERRYGITRWVKFKWWLADIWDWMIGNDE